MASRERWVDEGIGVLREQGIEGVRVDAVAARLGLTKGSFHHHFAGAADYRRRILERYEAETATALEHAQAAVGALPPGRALAELPRHVSFDPRLEAAIRGWAFHDEEARQAQARIDAARLGWLSELWNDVVDDPRRARAAALIPFLISVGAAVALPVPDEDDIAAVFALLADLVGTVRN